MFILDAAINPEGHFGNALSVRLIGDCGRGVAGRLDRNTLSGRTSRAARPAGSFGQLLPCCVTCRSSLMRILRLDSQDFKMLFVEVLDFPCISGGASLAQFHLDHASGSNLDFPSIEGLIRKHRL
jgi:hypothetical protein